MSNPKDLANFVAATVGHHYRIMMKATGYSADGLAFGRTQTRAIIEAYPA